MADRPSTREDSVLDALELLSRKWRPRILLALHESGPLGFNELQGRLPSISGKVLSDNLTELQERGLIERSVVNESPLRVEYDVTEAGRDLEAAFDALAAWGNQHTERPEPCILIADGDSRFTDLVRHWFSSTYLVREAHDVSDLREQLDPSVDVVIFDRGLSDPVFGEVPALVRSVDDTCRTIMLTAERPDFDIVDADCDTVVRKPTSKEAVSEAIEVQLGRRGQQPADRQRDALEERRRVLEETYPSSVLDTTDRYADLCDRIDRLSVEPKPQIDC